MEPVNGIDAMKDADIILYHGNGPISILIRCFDGTNVNHAALYLGRGKVGEALFSGLTERDFPESIKGNEYVIIRRLKSNPTKMEPVLGVAKDYIAFGNRYGFEQIVFLAFLGITRQLQVNKYLGWLLRKILDQAAELLMREDKKQPMICSEFVYRCYNEAAPAPGNPYALDINPFPFKAMTVSLKTGQRLSLRGMDEGSLLALVVNIATESKKVELSEAVPLRKGPGGEDLASLTMDELIKRYLDEVERQEPTRSILGAEFSLSSPEMLQSVDNFIKAYYRASAKKAGKVVKAKLVKAMEGMISPELAHMLETVANFVTPGDLYKCDNLYQVEKITP